MSGTLIRISVVRSARASRQAARPLWLWWSGPDPLDLAVIWHAYLRRFAIEHLFRFLKQCLAWTLPHLREPAAAARWTWLVVLAYLQLYLARDALADQRLPWERAPERPVVSPTRALRAFGHLWPVLGTPAQPPHPCGRAAGRPPGRRSPPAERHPVYRATG